MNIWLILVVLALFLSLEANAVDLPVGKKVYTIQVGSVKNKERAFKLLQKIKSLPAARVSYRNGRYKVRVGFFKNRKEALKFVNNPSFKKRFKRNFYITLIEFSPNDVYFANSTIPNGNKKSETIGLDVEKSNIEIQNQTRKEIHYQDFIPLTDTEKSNENRTSEHTKRLKNQGREYPYVFGLVKWTTLFSILLLGVAYSSYAFIANKNRKAKDIDVLVGELLGKENCEKLKEIIVPMVETDKRNVFLRKALIDCYLKEKKFIEAAALCEEISEILEEEGLEVLAKSFKTKAEEFLEKEFRGG